MFRAAQSSQAPGRFNLDRVMEATIVGLTEDGPPTVESYHMVNI
jgi:hypothetical protein